MLKHLSFLFLFIAVFSCQKDDEIILNSNTEAPTAIETLPSTDAYSVDPSILKTDWWREMHPTQQDLVGRELSHSGRPLVWSELEARLAAAAARPKVAGASPGYPLPNPEGDVVLNSQADVDDFGAQGYKEISGLLEIISTDPLDPICNLAALSKLKEVGSSVTISSECLATLDGLDKLKSIGELGPFGFIGVAGANLTDIEALAKLSTLTGSLNIQNTSQLTQVTDAFSKITTIESGKTTATITSVYVINISNNTALTDLSAFSGLTYLEGGFLFRLNGAITDLDDFSSLSSIGDRVSIFENPALQQVNALQNITSLSGNLILAINPVLTQCCGVYPLLCSDSPACTTSGVGGNVIIFDNGAGCTDTDIVANGPC